MVVALRRRVCFPSFIPPFASRKSMRGFRGKRIVFEVQYAQGWVPQAGSLLHSR